MTGINENLDEPIRHAVQLDASQLETGVYNYELMLASNYIQSSISANQKGSILVNNQSNSPFGAGWSLSELSRLKFTEDGNALLIEGDGSISNFRRTFDLDIGGFSGTRAGGRSFETGFLFAEARESLDTFFPGIPISSIFSLDPISLSNFSTIILTAVGSSGSIIPLSLPEQSALLQFVEDGGCAVLFADNVNFTAASESLIDPFGMDNAGGGGPFVDGIVTNPFSSTLTDGLFGLVSIISQGSPGGITNLGPYGIPLAENPVGDALVLIEKDTIVPGSGPVIVYADSDVFVTGFFPDNETLFLNTIEFCAQSQALRPDFSSPPGDFSLLDENLDGTFTRTLKDGTQMNFDSEGLQTSFVDRNGNTTQYAYDGAGLLTSITDPANQVTVFNYTGGLLTSITDPANRVTQFEYDLNNNLTRIIDPDGSQRFFDYDSQHRLVSQTSKRNFITTYTYDFAGRNIGATRPDSSVVSTDPAQVKGVVNTSVSGSEINPAALTRPADGASTFLDGNNNPATTTTNAFGAVLSATDALNRTTLIERDSDSNPTKITRANGSIVNLTYDAKGNLLTSNEQSIAATTAFTYEPTFNQVTSIKDPENNTTTINYDANGNPVEIIDAAGTITKLEYTDTNCPGQLTSVVAAFGLTEQNSTTFTYDPLTCNLLTTADPLLHTTTLVYDSAGNVTSTTDAENNITAFVYDNMNRLIQVTDAENGVTNYDYDDEGNLITVTDANLNTTTFAYDELNRLEKTTDPLSKFETFSYDGNGNLIQTTDRRSQTTVFEYDVANQLIKKTLPSTLIPGPLVTDFGYDLVGNLTSVIDPDSSLAFTYDGASRLTSATQTLNPSNPLILTLNYTYDKNGNRLTMTDSLTGTTNYVYDTLNRLTSITNPAAQPVSFDYDTLSRRTLTTFPNGVTSTFAYDDASQLTSLVHELGATTISSFGYTYDNAGNRVTSNQSRATLSVNPLLNYTYDNLYRLTQATNPLPATPDETFNYDSLGNRLLRDGQTTNAIFDDANRLLEDDDFTYLYDDNGNLIQTTDLGPLNTTTNYIYDAENQLIEIQVNSSTIAEYAYDGLGRRIQKDVGGAVTRYVYDNEDILFEHDGANVLQARYTHGVGIDEPLIMDRDLNANQTFESNEAFYYHTDGAGSIVDITDNLGAISKSYVYDSFGNIVLEQGTLENPYSFTGREYDPESGLFYYRRRYYDSTTGRFISEDPNGFDGGDLNLYSYVDSVGKLLVFNPNDFTNAYNFVGNNPVNFIDPFGLIKQLIRIGERVIIIDDAGMARTQERYDSTTKVLFESTVDAYLTTTGLVFGLAGLTSGIQAFDVGSRAIAGISTTCNIAGLQSGRSDLADVFFSIAGGFPRGIGIGATTIDILRKILGGVQ